MTSWEELLIATGGALKLEKCFYSVMSFEWIQGEWQYRDNSLNGTFGMTVPLLEGDCASIAHHPVTHVEKTLGAMTSPDGDSSSAIRQMQEKAQHWVDSVRNGHLHRHNVWFSLGAQFWPRVGYSLCASTATFDELEASLRQQYYQNLPLGGGSQNGPSGLQNG